MSARVVFQYAALLAVVSAHALGAQAPPSQQSSRPDQQAALSFRSGITAVPIDVRVVDKDNTPITDLRKEDFTVAEDGVPQTVAHFSAVTLVAQPPRAGLRASPDTPSFTVSPQNYRVFLIVIGTRGLGDTKRHPETLDALLDFIRHKLLPQDQVALLASGRATDFTADHERIARMLELYRGMEPAARPALAAPPVPAAEDPGSMFAKPAAFDEAPAIETELGFQDYVKARSGQPLTELESLFYGVSYLRFMEGEKHLLFLTERGPVPTWDQVKSLTTSASNARVALNTIQSDVRILDGMLGSPMPLAINQSGASTDNHPLAYNYNPNAPVNQPPPKPVLTPGGSMPEGARSPLAAGESAPIGGLPNAAAFGFGGIYDLRYVASQTGGVSSMWTDAAPVLKRIDDATRTHYLLAYYPTNSTWDGRYRAVTVKVNRPGAKVLFRHGYSAFLEVESFERRRVMADSRIASAGSRVTNIREIEVALVPSFAKAATGRGGDVAASFSIGATRLSWGLDDLGRHTASLDVAVYCADGNQKIIGQARRRLNFALTDETHARAIADGVARTIKIPVTGTPRFVKVIVYDYGADRVGSVMVPLK
jgi:VWFA-related protein